ncbi:DUF2949 domain-containing protein [Synechococcus sp. PCC 7502]|uniref:DUF2949 domain-containing protein n=1 Tax=Synechococcus sp. PCC 7502 TaxID=1173263 RepID=UPI000319991C|nr:DUF2949 domain-containing protein [Synechococcus sp. PCC 7502]
MRSQSAEYYPDSDQQELELYLIESALINQEQLNLAKKLQARQEGPLLMILLQLNFIDVNQFSGLIDWTPKARIDN